MSDVEVAQDTVTTMNDGASEESNAPVVEAVVETPAPVETAEPEKSTADRLDEIVAKVKAQKDKPIKEASPGKPGEVSVASEAYKPNFKYSIFQGKDKGEKEFEIPKDLQPFIKDAKTEKIFKDLLTKADGIDSVKAQRDEVKTQFEAANQRLGVLDSGIADMRKTYQSGDIDGFLNKLKIPEQVMMQWAINKAKYHSLPPEQKAEIDAHRQNLQQIDNFQGQTQTLSETNAQLAAKTKSLELELTLIKPEVSAVAAEFDKKLARTGAFKELVWNHGAMAWQTSGGKIDLTPEQAVQAVIEKYGLKPGEAIQVVATPAAQVAPTPGGMAAVQKKPITTIPNIRGGQTSPVGKQVPKRISDLKKTYTEKYGN